MKVLAVIPARAGSKGVPGKNIKKLSDKPLIQYSIEAAINSNLDRIIVSTDCKKIANLAVKLGVDVPFMRPPKLAADNSNSIDVMVHSLIEMEKLDNCKYEYLMMLQPTTPFRTYKNINDSLSLINESKKIDSVISVVDVQGNHPARMKFIKDGYLIDPIFCEKVENQNRQDLKKMYIRNGAIYLSKRECILKSSFKGLLSKALIMNKNESVNIDTADDFNYAEYMINSFK